MSESETAFIVQTYVAGARGALKAGETVRCPSEASARSRAEKIWALGKALGVEVVKQTVNVEAGDYSEPDYLVRLGKVPEV